MQSWKLRRAVVYVAAVVAVGSLYAQTSIKVDEASARENLLKHDDPVYPPIAKAAHVMGKVILAVQIGVNGQVIHVSTISGPPMLVGAATEAVKAWTFQPFLQDGVPTSAVTTLTIPFTLAPDDPQDLKTAEQFFPVSQKCVALVTQHGDPTEQAKVCRDAAEIADRFAHDARFIERRSAYVYCATALMRNKEPEAAVKFATKAVEVVKLGHDDGSGSAAAYGVKGQAEALSGDLAVADQDLTIAERYQRAALDTPAGHELAESYGHTLKSLLLFHAEVLKAMGKQTEADARTNEAGKL